MWSLCAECNNVRVCMRDRERGGGKGWGRESERWLHALLQRFIAPGHEIFLVHLVSSVLSPLSLPPSPTIPCFFIAKGGMGKGRWTELEGEKSWGGVMAVEAITMVTMPPQIFIKSLKYKQMGVHYNCPSWLGSVMPSYIMSEGRGVKAVHTLQDAVRRFKTQIISWPAGEHRHLSNTSIFNSLCMCVCVCAQMFCV